MMWLQDAAIRLVEHLQERPDGPMAFRFLMQPLMATIVAFRDGLQDGRTGRRAYLAALFGPGEGRGAALVQGLRATARILIIAAVLDAVYQVAVYRTFYPGETVIVALVLGFLPYALVRGTVGLFLRLR